MRTGSSESVDVPSSRWIHLTGCLHSGVYGKLTNQRACKSGGGGRSRKRVNDIVEWRVHVHSIDSDPSRYQHLSRRKKKEKGKVACARSLFLFLSFSLSLSLFFLSSLSLFSNRISFVTSSSNQRFDECTCFRSSHAEVDKENKYQQLGNVEKWPGSRAWYAEPPGTTRVSNQIKYKKNVHVFLSFYATSILALRCNVLDLSLIHI